MLVMQRPKVEALSEEDGHRQLFAVGPLEPGFGHTLGNSLRRTLLSSIVVTSGATAADCTVKAAGVDVAEPAELTRRVDPEWGAERLVNLVNAWSHELQEILGALGVNAVESLRGSRERLRAVGLSPLAARFAAKYGPVDPTIDDANSSLADANKAITKAPKAPDPGPWDVAFGAVFTSDYNFRGITQSNHKPSFSAYLEPRYNINPNLQAYAGTASPITFNGLVRQYYLRADAEQGD